VPALLGYRLYLEKMLEEAAVPVLQEVAIKQQLWQEKANPYQALRQAALSLSENSQCLAMVTSDPNQVFIGGPANILDYDEFFDIDITRSVLNLLDHHDLLVDLFSKAKGSNDIKVLIGSELELPNFEKCSLAFTSYRTGRYRGYLAVLGPCRLKYQSVLPLLRYIKNLIEDLGNLW